MFLFLTCSKYEGKEYNFQDRNEHQPQMMRFQPPDHGEFIRNEADTIKIRQRDISFQPGQNILRASVLQKPISVELIIKTHTASSANMWWCSQYCGYQVQSSFKFSYPSPIIVYIGWGNSPIVVPLPESIAITTCKMPVILMQQVQNGKSA